MKYISFYTIQTPYEDEIKKRLLPSLKKFNLDYDVQGLPDNGSWQANTALKSMFIKDMLLKHKQPVIFLDADAEIVKYPELFDKIPEDCDLAFTWLNWYGHWRGQWENTSKMHLLSGTMWWNYNDKVLKLLDEWINNVQANINHWEQLTLQYIIEKRNDLKIFELPYEYTTVLMQDYSIPKYIKEPVIIHHQASRLYKYRHNWPQT